MLSRKTCRKRTRELNQKNFPSEAWFEKILFCYGVGGYKRNPSLLKKYFGDFVWFNEKIVIEIDGASHIGKEEYDKKRDEDLTTAGFKVCRIRMGDVLHAERIAIRLKEIVKEVRYINPRIPPRFKKRKKKKKKNLGKRKKGRLIATCYTDSNAKMLSDLKRRKSLWVHPSKRKRS